MYRENPKEILNDVKLLLHKLENYVNVNSAEERWHKIKVVKEIIKFFYKENNIENKN